MNWQPATIELAAGTLAYHRSGGGLPPLVLAHGLTDNGLCWSRVARHLASEFDVIALDAAGHGNSYRIDPDQPPDPAADIKGVITTLDLQRPLLLGHSVGARAMADFAQRWPDLPGAIILEDPPLVRPLDDPARLARQATGFAAYVADLALRDEQALYQLGHENHPEWAMEEVTPWVLAKRQLDTNAMMISRFGPWQDAIRGITAPVLLITGEAGLGSLSAARIDEARALNTTMEIKVIEGAGHNIRREQFAAYLEVTRAFLRNHQTVTPGEQRLT